MMQHFRQEIDGVDVVLFYFVLIAIHTYHTCIVLHGKRIHVLYF